MGCPQPTGKLLAAGGYFNYNGSTHRPGVPLLIAVGRLTTRAWPRSRADSSRRVTRIHESGLS